ncbi:TPA: DUF6708 domain-containing protein [Pseudomonas putida]
MARGSRQPTLPRIADARPYVVGWPASQLFSCRNHQQGPEALPKFVHPPRDWNDDDGLSHMHCLAPKVHWPEDIDRESRTAPSEGEAL